MAGSLLDLILTQNPLTQQNKLSTRILYLKIKFRVDYSQIKSAIFFEGIIDKDERIDLTICNPPFHASMEEALQGTRRKVKNLSGKKRIFRSLILPE